MNLVERRRVNSRKQNKVYMRTVEEFLMLAIPIILLAITGCVWCVLLSDY